MTQTNTVASPVVQLRHNHRAAKPDQVEEPIQPSNASIVSRKRFNPLVATSTQFALASFYSFAWVEGILLFVLGVSSVVYHTREQYGVRDVFFFVDQLAIASNVGYQLYDCGVEKFNLGAVLSLLSCFLFFILVVRKAKHNTMDRKWKHVVVHLFGTMVWVFKNLDGRWTS